MKKILTSMIVVTIVAIALAVLTHRESLGGPAAQMDPSTTSASATAPYGTDSSPRGTMIARFQSAEIGFLQRASAQPNETVVAVVTLRTPATSQELQTLFSDPAIVVRTIYQTTGVSNGGYSLDEGETIDQATVAIEERYRRMLAGPSPDHDELLRTFGDDGAVRRYEEEMQQIRRVLESHNLRFYGARVEGKAASIALLKQSAFDLMVAARSDVGQPVEPVRAE